MGSLIAFNEFPGRNLAFSLVNTGMGLPPVVVGLIVAIMLWRSGPLGQLSLIYTPAAMVIAQTVIAAPIVTGFTAAALRNLSPRLRRSSTAWAPRGSRCSGSCSGRRSCHCWRR